MGGGGLEAQGETEKRRCERMANEISSRFGAVAFCEFLLFYVFFFVVCFIKKSAFVTRKNNRSFSTRDRHFLFNGGWRVGVRPDEIRANRGKVIITGTSRHASFRFGLV